MTTPTVSRRGRRRGRTAGQLCWASAAGLSGWVVIAPGDMRAGVRRICGKVGRTEAVSRGTDDWGEIMTRHVSYGSLE